MLILAATQAFPVFLNIGIRMQRQDKLKIGVGYRDIPYLVKKAVHNSMIFPAMQRD